MSIDVPLVFICNENASNVSKQAYVMRPPPPPSPNSAHQYSPYSIPTGNWSKIGAYRNRWSICFSRVPNKLNNSAVAMHFLGHVAVRRHCWPILCPRRGCHLMAAPVGVVAFSKIRGFSCSDDSFATYGHLVSMDIPVRALLPYFIHSCFVVNILFSLACKSIQSSKNVRFVSVMTNTKNGIFCVCVCFWILIFLLTTQWAGSL